MTRNNKRLAYVWFGFLVLQQQQQPQQQQQCQSSALAFSFGSYHQHHRSTTRRNHLQQRRNKRQSQQRLLELDLSVVVSASLFVATRNQRRQQRHVYQQFQPNVVIMRMSSLVPESAPEENLMVSSQLPTTIPTRIMIPTTTTTAADQLREETIERDDKNIPISSPPGNAGKHQSPSKSTYQTSDNQNWRDNEVRNPKTTNSNKFNNNNNYYYSNRKDNNKIPANAAAARAFNHRLVKCETAKEVLEVATSSKLMMTHCAGGGTMNSINFSTSLHRIARYVMNAGSGGGGGTTTTTTRSTQQQRVLTLADPRFAILVCSIAEAMAGMEYTLPLSTEMKQQQFTSTSIDLPMEASSATQSSARIVFQSREMSNIAWALAKLRLIPPQKIFPLTTPTSLTALFDKSATSSTDTSTTSTTSSPTLLQPIYQQLIEKSFQVRYQLLEAARRRKSTNDNMNDQYSDDKTEEPLWITSLSQLAALVLDTISYSVLVNTNTLFQSQEWSNLLWAMATTQRANPLVFDSIATRLMSGMSALLEKQQQQGPRDGVRPQECSNSIWAFATAQVTGPVQEQLLVFVADLMEDADFLQSFKPQELSNTAWGIATLLTLKKQSLPSSLGFPKEEEQAALRILRHVAKSLVTRADDFKSQEISNSAWAMATLGFGGQPSSSVGTTANSSVRSRASEMIDSNDYIVLVSDQVDKDEKLLKQALESLAQSALSRLSSFRSQELNNLAWSMARLLKNASNNVLDDPQLSGRIFELLEGIGRELSDPRRKVTSQDAGTTLWSFANLEYFDAEIYRGIAARLDIRRGQDYKPQELSNTIWAMANNPNLSPQEVDVFDSTFAPLSTRKEMMARADPVTTCFAIAANELMQRPFDFKPQEVKDVLWSFSKAGLRHPRLFRSVAEHLVGMKAMGETQQSGRGLEEFSPQGMGNLAWAYARQAQLAQDTVKRFDVGSSMQGRLAMYTAIYLDIGEDLMKRLFATLAETNLRVHDGLSKLKPQDLANSCWAFAVLGLRHTEFMNVAYHQLVDRMGRFVRGQGDPFMTRFKGQELANLVWAFATLNCPFFDLPSAIAPYMVAFCNNGKDGVAVTPKRIAHVFKRQELANVAWSCAVIGSYPRDLIQLLYTGLIGNPKESDPNYMRQVYGDSGLQLQATMSLLYLQISLDTCNPQNQWKLPHSFPDGWFSMSESSSGQDGMDTTCELELNLSPSKIQKSVSSTLSRIGFRHVQEHEISLKELNEQGIQLAPLPISILSIDIADVSGKVGIEVDGPAHFLSVIDNSNTDYYGGDNNNNMPAVVSGKLEYTFRWDDRAQQSNGPTALKQRILSSLGWKVIHLPFWEWQALNGDAALEEEYCRNLLSKI